MIPTLSIIIPAYNAEMYLGETLDSLLLQSSENIEIILLNDGSDDNTANICAKYATQHSCIVFINKENEGVSRTRNMALDIAHGTYIMFIDADDVIYPGSLQIITNALRYTNVDLLRYEFKTINEKGKDLYPNYEIKRRAKYINEIMSAPDFMNKVMGTEYQLCFNVFKTELLNRYNIRFLENCTYNEDMLFLVSYFKYSQTHIYIPHIVYGYRKYTGAVTNKFTERNFHDALGVFKRIMLSLPEDKDLHNAMRAVAEHLGRSLYIHNMEFKDEKTQYLIKKYCGNHPVTIDWKLYNYIGDVSWSILDFFRKIIRRIAY